MVTLDLRTSRFEKSRLDASITPSRKAILVRAPERLASSSPLRPIAKTPPAEEEGITIPKSYGRTDAYRHTHDGRPEEHIMAHMNKSYYFKTIAFNIP
ncbi:hypothetical protein CHU98_g198 [Xylaria longipes]|nr:hypothetical protein CHU98_g198 [Xylaria longipes]